MFVGNAVIKMASERQAAKRPRIDDGASAKGRTPCPVLWFEDGNVVLATKTRLFRVHRGIMALNSSAFSDMFAMPQPEGLAELHEGLPLVELAGDDDEGMQHFLRCIYDRSCVL